MINTMNNSNIKKINLCSLGSLAARGPGLVEREGPGSQGEQLGQPGVRQSGSQMFNSKLSPVYHTTQIKRENPRREKAVQVSWG